MNKLIGIASCTLSIFASVCFAKDSNSHLNSNPQDMPEYVLDKIKELHTLEGDESINVSAHGKIYFAHNTQKLSYFSGQTLVFDINSDMNPFFQLNKQFEKQRDDILKKIRINLTPDEHQKAGYSLDVLLDELAYSFEEPKKWTDKCLDDLCLYTTEIDINEIFDQGQSVSYHFESGKQGVLKLSDFHDSKLNNYFYIKNDDLGEILKITYQESMPMAISADQAPILSDMN
tara:strand:+ start:6276 stop:6968 length:693 start_codon:yes stop_codon:yes gene_type:complete